MHRLSKMDLDSICIEHVDPQILKRMREIQQEYNNNPIEENWLTMIYSYPSGLKLTARMTTNFRQLKTIYQQRKDHRIPEWKEFCRWIRELDEDSENLIINPANS